MNSRAQISSFVKVLESKLPNIKIVKNATFKNYTTIGVGGKIFAMALVDSEPKLMALLGLCQEHNISYFVLGNGSNILASDKTFYDLVIKIEMKSISKKGNKIIAASGVNMFALNQFAIASNLGGLEWSYGLPGSVGGAIKMNAGSFGHEIGEFVSLVYYTDGKKVYKKYAKSLHFSYRQSYFSNSTFIILSAVFCLKEAKSDEIKHLCQHFYQKRLDTQPYSQKSAGSIFKRPQGNFAPVLIQSCGLKGYKIGDAQVSDKHCGFIVNLKNAKFNEIFKIICKIKKTVSKKFDIILQEEVVILK